jgi:hypothetical protein
MDIVITTAQVPGRRPPLLVTADAVGRMKPGSVIVDMAASALGGNVELSKPDERVVTDNGVVILAPTNLPATMPAGASQFYARNLATFVAHFLKDGALAFDFDEEITAATVITHDGAVVQKQTLGCSGRRRDRDDVRARCRADHLHPGRAGRLRGDQQGAGNAAHAADVGGQRDPRHRARRVDAHRRHRVRHPQPVARLRGGRLRLDERRRRLRGDRPDAPDVQAPPSAVPTPAETGADAGKED